MVKILITTIQVNFVPIDQAAPNSPELLLLKFLPLTYHHSHFLAATLDFPSFFTIAFSRAALLFFTAWLFLIRYKLQNILSSCCPLNTNCYNSEDQSETMHDILFAYKTAKIIGSKKMLLRDYRHAFRPLL